MNAWKDSLRQWSQSLYSIIWIVSQPRPQAFDLTAFNATLRTLVHNGKQPTGAFVSIFPLWAKDTVAVNITEAELKPFFDDIMGRFVELLVVDLVALFEATLEDIGLAKFGSADGETEARIVKLGFDQARFPWALVRIVEMTCFRNCLVHSQGVWSERAVNRLVRFAKDPTKLPTIGSRVRLNLLHLVAYKSAVRTVLNQCETPTKKKKKRLKSKSR